MQHGLMNMAWSAALVVVVGGHASAEIEVQTGRVIGERFGNGPVTFTADPFHKFDPMGGTRRLDRVIIDVGFDWECVVQLANPEPVVQEVRYNAIPGFAYLPTNTDVDFTIERLHEPNGTLVADPLQTVQNTHTRSLSPLTYAVLDPNEPFFQSFGGAGPLNFEALEFGAAFDTRRFVNGVPMGAPNGFSVQRELWDVQLTFAYEYSVVPSAPTAFLAGFFTLIQSANRGSRLARRER